MNELIHLGPFDLAVAAVLVVAAGCISLAMRLDIEKRLALSALRTVVQLGLVGLILERVFAIRRPIFVVLILAVMIFFAGREAARRSTRRYPGIRFDAWLAMAATCLIVGTLVTQVVVGVKPWYDPQYVIPLLGMILGNSLTGVSLCLERFLEHLSARKHEVELMLAFGATRGEALAGPMRAAVRTGMIPVTNMMAAAGIVALPGMMTGQILAGAPPMQAVAYQIVIMFMLAGANAIGSMIIASAAARRLVAADGRLRSERLGE
ncbi:MAG: iron export ABC transporter permease subunit FetB [Thermoanaerobaculales bacterium]|nr:iron export ABC transporter permease subunit FetB [Thermoanaerobaculales bacterium]